MSVGLILLIVLSALVLLGVLQRVLDKMGLSDRSALLFAFLIFAGSFLPNIQIFNVKINVGGAIIPFILCIYLFIHADTKGEFWRSILGSVVTAGVILLFSSFLPSEPTAITLDPNYIWGIIGGIVAYTIGRSRRNAFICGTLGVLLSDIFVGVLNAVNGVQQSVVLGGAGALDATVISGIIAVLLAELIGEVIERMARKETPKESYVHTPVHHHTVEKKEKEGRK